MRSAGYLPLHRPFYSARAPVAADPVGSSLALQKLLYFNLFYSPAFGAAHIALLVYKTVYLTASRITSFVLPVIVVVWCLLEIARLRLGYFGNLRERVSPASHGRYSGQRACPLCV